MSPQYENGKLGKLKEQKWLNGMQIVHFEAPGAEIPLGQKFFDMLTEAFSQDTCLRQKCLDFVSAA